jgi:hypothetical protein
MVMHREIDQLRERYEHWNRLYHKSGHMNSLVRAQYYLSAYMKAVNNSHISQADIRVLEDKYAQWDRHLVNDMSSNPKQRTPGHNQLRIYESLKDMNDWTTVKELMENLILSSHCVRTSLLKLISDNKVEKRQNNRHPHKRAEYRVKND